MKAEMPLLLVVALLALCPFCAHTQGAFHIPGEIERMQQGQKQEQQREQQQQIQNLNHDVESNSKAVQGILEQYNSLTNVAEQLKYTAELKRRLPEDPWRLFEGHPVFIKIDSRFTEHSGKITQTTSEGILISEDYGYDVDRLAPYTKTVFVKHYPYIRPDDSRVQFFAAASEPYQYNSVLGAAKVVEALDYGVPCLPPKNANEVEAEAFRITPQDVQKINENATNAIAKLAAAQADLEAAQKKLQDFLQGIEDEKEAPIKQAQEKARIAQEKVAAAKKAALKANQDAAGKGDPIGLMRMGERYRDGDGVEKDLTQARAYLQKAADAGSPTAAEELKQLPQN